MRPAADGKKLLLWCEALVLMDYKLLTVRVGPVHLRVLEEYRSWSDCSRMIHCSLHHCLGQVEFLATGSTSSPGLSNVQLPWGPE